MRRGANSVHILAVVLMIHELTFHRGIHDLQHYVNDTEYQRIMNFMYLKSKGEVDTFGSWIKGLKNPKVQGMSPIDMLCVYLDLLYIFLRAIAWWDHKVNNTWILPSLVKCLSKMDSGDWDRTPPTTNIGEAQHHWTNINTGVSLSLLEAILT